MRPRSLQPGASLPACACAVCWYLVLRASCWQPALLKAHCCNCQPPNTCCCCPPVPTTLAHSYVDYLNYQFGIDTMIRFSEGKNGLPRVWLRHPYWCVARS